PTRCAERIADIWRDGHGVIVVPVIIKVCDDDALRREAAIIFLKDYGLKNLVNSASGVFKGHEHWSAKDRMELGVMQLVKAFKLYREKALRQWYISDIPGTTMSATISDSHSASSSAGDHTLNGRQGKHAVTQLNTSDAHLPVSAAKQTLITAASPSPVGGAQAQMSIVTSIASDSASASPRAGDDTGKRQMTQPTTAVGSVVAEKDADDDNTLFSRIVAGFLNSLPREQQRPARIRLEGVMQEIEFPQASILTLDLELGGHRAVFRF
ncbi:ankyrin repeat domain 41, partial [Aphelenchoides avenae]